MTRYLPSYARRNWEKQAIVGIVLAGLYVLRRPDMLLVPQLWAEDGQVFLQNAFDHGIQSLFMTYAGYQNLLSRILTFASISLSLRLMQSLVAIPLFMNLFAVLVDIACVAFLCSRHFDWLASWPRRSATVVCIVCVSGIFEIYGTVTNVNWWLGWLQFLVALHVFHTNRFPASWMMVLFLLSGLSGPFVAIPAAMLTGLMLWRYWKVRTIHLPTLAIIAVMLVCAAIQAWTTLHSRPPVGETLSLTRFLATFPSIVLVRIYARLVFLDFVPSITSIGITTSALIGLAFIGMLFVRNRGQRALLTWCFGYSTLLMIIAYVGDGSNSLHYDSPFIDIGQRYFFMPISIALLLLLCNAGSLPVSRTYRILSLGTVLAVLATILANFSFTPFYDYEWPARVAVYAPHATGRCPVSINPVGWQVVIPCVLNQSALSSRIHVDLINGVPTTVGERLTVNRRTTPALTLAGWAVDEGAGRPLAGLFVAVDGTGNLAGGYGFPRDDIARILNTPRNRLSGFIVSMYTTAWAAGQHTITMQAVSIDGVQYAPGYRLTVDVQ